MRSLKNVQHVFIHFVRGDTPNIPGNYYLLKEKYWQGRAQSNFELWPVMLTGQTSYSLAKAHFLTVKMLKNGNKILL